MWRKRQLIIFKDEQHKDTILKNIFKDYVIEDMTIKELADNYGYSERQIRYIIEKYLNFKKGSGCKKKMELEIERIDKDNFIINDKLYKRSTLENLVEKAERAKRKMNKNKSTNTQVENNK